MAGTSERLGALAWQPRDHVHRYFLRFPRNLGLARARARAAPTRHGGNPGQPVVSRADLLAATRAHEQRRFVRTIDRQGWAREGCHRSQAAWDQTAGGDRALAGPEKR